jgi:hypothetical protein
VVLDFLRDQPVPDALKEASRFLSTWHDERIAADPSPPRVLYHYTNVAALMNILRTGEMWATNAAYTNDQTEVLHSLLQLRRLVESDLKDRQNDPAVDSMLQVADEFYTIVEAYLVCFCANGDLLSQWRGYGQAGGYAIGVDSASLAHLIQTGHVMLVPVIYDVAEQDRLMHELVDRWRSVFKDIPSEQDVPQVRRLGAFVFAQAFSYLAMAFKNSAFGEEQEWRLVYRRQVILPDDGTGLQVSFRDRDGMVAPYVAMIAVPTKDGSTARFPVSRIVMGPTNYPKLAGHGMVRFLASLGYPTGAVTVDLSVVPLRT